MRRVCLLILLAGCGHDAKRENPLDPQLTPPVTLTASLNDTTGAVTLSWTPYAGDEPFAAYWVLRKARGLEAVDTLASLADETQSTFVDTSLAPDTPVEYRVSIVNTSGLEAPSRERSVTGFSVNAVSLLTPQTQPDEGTITLQWSTYRDPDFVSYTLLRREVGDDDEESLGTLTSRNDTAFVDRTALHNINYQYSVVVSAAGQTLRGTTAEARLILPGVQLLAPIFDSATASAALTWTPYVGPGFRAYEVRRRTGVLARVTVEVIEDIADTSTVDDSLLGNTDYIYDIVVQTDRGEQINSVEMSGGIHQFLASWAITSSTRRPFVRLYSQDTGVTAVLVDNPAGDGRVQVIRYDAQGQVVEHWNIVEASGLFRAVGASQHFALATDEEGRSLAVFDRDVGTFEIRSFDQVKLTTDPMIEPFPDALLGQLEGEYGTVLSEIVLLPSRFSDVFSDVAVLRGEEILFRDDFAGWPVLFGESYEWAGWELQDAGIVENPGRNFLGGSEGGTARRADETWQGDFRLEADVMGSSVSGPSKPAIQIGGDTYSRFVLGLDIFGQEITLDWYFTPPDSSALETRHERFTAPMVLMGEVPYRLALEMTNGRPRAWVQSFVRGPAPAEVGAIAAASLGDGLAVTVDDEAFFIRDRVVSQAAAPLPGWVGEIRVWEGRRGQEIGICLPATSLIQTGTIPDGTADEWPLLLTRDIGPAIGGQEGLLSYPVSFDVGPDGRFYVLDAGSSRVLVFDRTRRFLTKWGSRGDGDGEFDLGGRARRPGGNSTSVARWQWTTMGSYMLRTS